MLSKYARAAIYERVEEAHAHLDAAAHTARVNGEMALSEELSECADGVLNLLNRIENTWEDV